MFIYLDESGDLGFDFSKNKTSKKFVITLLVCHTQSAQKDFKKAVRRTLKNKLNKKKSKNRDEIKDFNRYIKNQIESLLPLNTALRVDHLNSQNDTGLQSVDLFCWGIFRKYEFGDDRWYKSYQHKIKYITEYLPDLSV